VWPAQSQLLKLIKEHLDKPRVIMSWALFNYNLAKKWRWEHGGLIGDYHNPNGNANCFSFSGGEDLGYPVPKNIPGPYLDRQALRRRLSGSSSDMHKVARFFDEASRQIGDEPTLDCDITMAAPIPVSKIPETLQEQIDAEWKVPPGAHPFRAWEVPVPAWIDATAYIYSDTQAILTWYFHGLELFHSPINHTVRPVLPPSQRREKPKPHRPTELIRKFRRANAELWKWVDEVRREKTIVSIVEWINRRAERQEREQEQLVNEHCAQWMEHPGFGAKELYFTEESERGKWMVRE
jgi:hypothetical protein